MKYIHIAGQPSPHSCFHPAERKLRPHPLFSQSLATTALHSVSMSLTTLGSSCKGNNTVFVFLWRADFTEHNVLTGHPCSSMSQNSLPFKGRIIFHRVYRPRFVYPFHLSEVASTSWLWWIMLHWTRVCKYLWGPVFRSFGYILYRGVKSLDPMVILVLIFWGTACCFS